MKIINAKVHSGFGLGKQMGFPTLNLRFDASLLGLGVYTTDSEFGKAIVIVTDPGVAECHIPGKNLHGQNIKDLSLTSVIELPNQGNGLLNLLWSGCYYKKQIGYMNFFIIIVLIIITGINILRISFCEINQ